MKKLLCSAAVIGLALAATPAHAASNGLKLDLGGWFKGYGAWVDQDVEDDADAANGDYNDLDVVRHTEVHFGGETTLDNGLTVGVHIESEADGGDSFDVEESYAYFSNGMGRINFGAEDGAAYLLQVEAPSADDNYDGLRQYVNPTNYAVMTDGAAAINSIPSLAGDVAVDYDNAVTGYADKLTYLSPIFNGFQFGASYTPDGDYANDFGVGTDDVENAFGDSYELAARYEGQFNNVGVILGAGYVTQSLEQEEVGGAGAGDPTDDRTSWDAGADFDIGPFGIGVSYLNDDRGDLDTTGGVVDDAIDEEEIWVFGVDYTTGPFKLGASYYDGENTFGRNGLETQRWTGGVVYTYGPGMTFRGSVSQVQHDNADAAAATGGLGLADSELESTTFLFGTQINF
jgi:outer membrane protein OmpU